MSHLLPVSDDAELSGVSELPQRVALFVERIEPPATRDDRDAAHEEADAELRDRIQAALHCGAYPLRSVSAIVTQRRVLLIGWVSSFYLKQVAQESVRTIPGVRGLANRLVVTSS